MSKVGQNEVTKMLADNVVSLSSRQSGRRFSNTWPFLFGQLQAALALEPLNTGNTHNVASRGRQNQSEAAVCLSHWLALLGVTLLCLFLTNFTFRFINTDHTNSFGIVFQLNNIDNFAALFALTVTDHLCSL